MQAAILELLSGLLRTRMTEGARTWFAASRGEIDASLDEGRFAQLFSGAARHARDRVPLDPGDGDRQRACELVPGWDPERWTLLETLRVALLLCRPANHGSGAAERGCAPGKSWLEGLFRYADEGEQRALYRSLALLPEPESFVWRAGEGCRTNMVSVFEAVTLDTPYPARFFDDVAWRQAITKCVFIGAPLWRMWGLDDRLSEELARMALDLMDERRSAHRTVQPELWLCLGSHAGARALASIERELAPANEHRIGRRAAAMALARRGDRERLTELLKREEDSEVQATMRAAIEAVPPSRAFQALRPEEG